MEIPIINWFDKPVKEAIGNLFSELRDNTEAMDIFCKYRKRAVEVNMELYGKLSLLGIEKPVNLHDIYSPAYVSKTILRRSYKDSNWFSESKDYKPIFKLPTDTGSIPAEVFIEDNQRSVILGGPGSGKTTLLRHIALAYSEYSLFQRTKLKKSYLPIYIDLARFARSKRKYIDLYYVTKFKQKDDKYCELFISKMLEHGSAIILLDALDEVSSQDSQRIVDSINDLLEKYPKAKMIVTCRTADYDSCLQPFAECELLRFTPDAVSKVIDAWFPDDEKRCSALKMSLENDDSIAGLVRTPLLLSLLCIQFRHDLRLPKRKCELYSRCISALLWEWDAGRGFRRDTSYSSLSDSRKEMIFGSVAQRFSEPDVSFIFPAKEVRLEVAKCIEKFSIDGTESASVLREIESHHGILEKYSREYYVFSHPSFQEYYIAKKTLLTRRECESVKSHIDDENWFTIIQFMAAMAENPVPMLDILFKESRLSEIKNFPPAAKRTRRLRLLFRCIAAGAAVPKQKRNAILDHIIDSQIEMLRIFRSGGVYPIVGLLPKGGLVHSYYFTKRRPTLVNVLEHYRRLSSEILYARVDSYSERLAERIGLPDLKGPQSVNDVIQILNLVTPIASQSSVMFHKWYKWMDMLRGYSFLNDALRDNLKVIKEKYEKPNH